MALYQKGIIAHLPLLYLNRYCRIHTSTLRVDGKIKCRDMHNVQSGNRNMELSAVEQLVEENQTRAIGDTIDFIALRYGFRLFRFINNDFFLRLVNEKDSLRTILETVDKEFSTKGMDSVSKVLFSDIFPLLFHC